MLIPAARRELKDGLLEVPSWQRAPLNLNLPSGGVMAVEVHESDADPPSIDLIISNFPEDTWADLWRIEVETFDRIGNLYAIAEILRRRKIRILAAEGSVNSFSLHHTMNFIVACHQYNDPGDEYGTFDRRWKAENPRLAALELDIRANLAADIVFNNFGAPKLKVKRLADYRRLHLLKESEQLEIARCTQDKHSLIQIPPAIMKIIHDQFGPKVGYSTLADTKNRLIRAMMFSADAQRYAHVQLSIPTGSDRGRAMTALLDQLAGKKLNISRFQMRPGASNEMRRLGIAPEEYSRLDLTISAKPHENTILNRIAEVLSSHAVRQLSIRIIRSRSNIYGDPALPADICWPGSFAANGGAEPDRGTGNQA